MSDGPTNQEAKEGLESIGMWMDARYNIRFVGTPIQTWNIPPKEKDFFTVYAMNLVLESDGFAALVGQDLKDVEAFVDLLRQLGAEKTSEFVQSTLAALKSKTPCDEYESTSKYYKLFESEKVWLKLMDLLGRGIYMSYVFRAQAISEAGGNIFDPKQWQGDMPEKKWWEIWK
jgi:hypothetical protein